MKWKEYYKERLCWFGADKLVVIDDGTPSEFVAGMFELIPADGSLPKQLPDGVVMFRFSDNLGRCTKKCFPGWWRSFAFSLAVARQYEYSKIIHLESDAFVLTPRLAEQILSLQNGWTALWCPSWNFAESAIQVICQDCFAELEKLSKREDGCRAPWHVKGFAEKLLPFTRVVKEPFQGDRYSEYRSNYRTDADYVCQSRLEWNFQSYLKQAPPW